MTNTLLGRTEQHREQAPGTHTAQYNIHRLVYFEFYKYVRNAIAREKELKKWTRAQKIALIEKANPTWEDLYLDLIASEKQIPFGDDNQKSNSESNGNGNSESNDNSKDGGRRSEEV